MKITRLETFLANAGLRNYLFVRLTADGGLTGLGEASLEWQERTVQTLMHEWVEDGSSLNYEDHPSDGSPWYSDPRRIEGIVRGGSYNSSEREIRTYFRGLGAGPDGSVRTGFRCAADPLPAE